MSNLVDQRFENTIDAAITTLTKFSIPLYLNTSSGPVQFGTGFFVRRGEDCFLVSAAHVLDKSLSHGLYYYVTPNIIRHISGRLVRSKTNGSRDEDTIDIGVVKMTGNMLPPYPDVQKFAMDIAYLAPSYVPRSGKHYAFIGFPGTKTKVSNINRSIEAQAYAYRSDSILVEEYSIHGVSPNTHVVIPMNLRKGFDSTGNLIHFPKPQGMSGSPVVVLYELEDGGHRTFPVVAVAIEYRKPKKIVIATDVQYVLEAIDHAT